MHLSPKLVTTIMTAPTWFILPTLGAAALKQELGDDKVQVAAIGLAGENRVYMASIEHSHSSASRGVGPVMGDKRLKAIAVRGRKNPQYPDPPLFRDIVRDQNKAIKVRSEGMSLLGTAGGVEPEKIAALVVEAAKAAGVTNVAIATDDQ